MQSLALQGKEAVSNRNLGSSKNIIKKKRTILKQWYKTTQSNPTCGSGAGNVYPDVTTTPQKLATKVREPKSINTHTNTL